MVRPAQNMEKNFLFLDFETEAIKPFEGFPKPFGMGVKVYQDGQESETLYIRNVEHMRKVIESVIYDDTFSIVGHNIFFDLGVAFTHLIDVERLKHVKCNVVCTRVMLFLENPYRTVSGLKDTAKLFGWQTDEKDELQEFCVAHMGKSASKVSPKYYMKFLNEAPVELVAKYCKADIDLTVKMYKHLYPKLEAMSGAFARECSVITPVVYSTIKGLSIDTNRLKIDVDKWAHVCLQLRHQVADKLDMSANDVDSPSKCVEALVKKGLVDINKIQFTKNGKPKGDKKVLEALLQDKELIELIERYRTLQKYLSTFMQPWLNHNKGGKISVMWNTVKGHSFGSNSEGTITGRMSSTPNLQNIPKAKEDLEYDMPNVRHYIIPSSGCVLVDADYSQQEPRIMAHFEKGRLMKQFNDDPKIDFHTAVQTMLKKEAKVDIDRRTAKILNLGIMYGMGVHKLAAQLKVPVEKARMLKATIYRLYPGLEKLYKVMEERRLVKKPIRTWGGRLYYCAEDKEIKGVMMSQSYILVNHLIQGSAADCTKQAIINLWGEVKKGAPIDFLLSVHDEILVQCATEYKEECKNILQKSMQELEFNVPMLVNVSDGFSWGEIK